MWPFVPPGDSHSVMHVCHSPQDCLISWLESQAADQYGSCPKCRQSLNPNDHVPARGEEELETALNQILEPEPNLDETDETESGAPPEEIVEPGAPAEELQESGWSFRIPSLASWLPSVSFELVRSTHPNGLDAAVNQLHELFPHLPRSALAHELRRTGSLDVSVERILTGVVQIEQAVDSWSGDL